MVLQHQLLLRFCGEVLPYLEIRKEKEEIQEIVEMPNVTGITYAEAKKTLKNVELEIDSTLEEEDIVTDQLPKPGIKINKGTKINLYK